MRTSTPRSGRPPVVIRFSYGSPGALHETPPQVSVMPNSVTTGAGAKCSCTSRIVSGGPVSLTRRIALRSVRSKSGWWMRSWVIAGKVGYANVIRSVLEQSAAPRSASKYALVTRVAPTCMCASSGKTWPMWNIGSGFQKRSSCTSSQRSAAATPVRTRASWVSTHPFGLVVVPDVYISIASSRSLTRRRALCTSATGTPSPAATNAAGRGIRRASSRRARSGDGDAGAARPSPRRSGRRDRRARAIRSFVAIATMPESSST